MAVAYEDTGGHVGIQHYSPDKFFRAAKNIFLVDQLLLWHLAEASVARGDIFVVKGRVHITAFAEFALGVNGNGEEARGLKVGLIEEAGVVRVATVFPIEAGVGTINIHTT